MHRRADAKFVTQAVEALKLQGVSAAQTPPTKELERLESPVELSEDEAWLYRHVVCKVMRCQADYVAAQYVIKEPARGLQKPTE
eukprot:2342677-Lingulodinium_polyedra.AAC.1